MFINAVASVGSRCQHRQESDCLYVEVGSWVGKALLKFAAGSLGLNENRPLKKISTFSTLSVGPSPIQSTVLNSLLQKAE